MGIQVAALIGYNIIRSHNIISWYILLKLYTVINENFRTNLQSGFVQSISKSVMLSLVVTWKVFLKIRQVLSLKHATEPQVKHNPVISYAFLMWTEGYKMNSAFLFSLILKENVIPNTPYIKRWELSSGMFNRLIPNSKGRTEHVNIMSLQRQIL